MHVLHELLLCAADAAPDRIAILGKGETATYAQLAARARQLAHTLIAAGARPGEPVALCLGKSVDTIAGAFGILMAGCAYVPVDPLSPPRRAAEILAACGARHAVAGAAELARVLEPGAPPLRAVVVAGTAGPGPIAQLAWDEGPAVALPRVIDTYLAYILHTSGSTGRPKGVAISHRNALAFVDMATAFFGIRETDRLACHAPLHFDLSVFDIYCAARARAAMVLVPELYAAFPHKLTALIDEHRVTVWSSVVSALTLMVDRGKLDARVLDSLRLVLFSGELMPPRVLRRLVARLPAARFYNLYGQTEANSSMYFPVEDVPAGDDWRLPIGTAFPGYEVFALDDHGQLVDRPGVEGELHVRGSAVAVGYYRDPARTGEKFVLDPLLPDTGASVYRTGDLVRLDEAGQYLFVGRRDNLVKSRGYRIELDEVELALSACGGVEHAVVLALPDPHIGNRLVGVVTAAMGATLSKGDVLDALRARLPRYMVPDELDIRSELPRTTTGKVDRNALRAELSSTS